MAGLLVAVRQPVDNILRHGRRANAVVLHLRTVPEGAVADVVPPNTIQLHPALSSFDFCYKTSMSPAVPALLEADIKISDPDPLDTERFASASDYSKGENLTPAKAQLQTIVRRDKQRVRLNALHIS